jgi:dTDP-4-dehydrorhamnose reductase
MKNVFITGGSGLLGKSLIHFSPQNYSICATFMNHPISDVTSIKIDLKNSKVIKEKIKAFKPDLIIHTAAATNLEWCELHPKEAYSINVEATKVIVNTAKSLGSKFVYISTDSVFDGKRGWYTEEDIPHPINVYSKTKLYGEKESLLYNDSLIIRTTFFGCHSSGKKETFLLKLLKNLNQKKMVEAPIDKISNPLIVSRLSCAIYQLVEKNVTGIFNVASLDPMSSYEFAVSVADIFDLDKNLIKKIKFQELMVKKSLVQRPLNTSLDPTKTSKLIVLPSIKESIIELRKTF